ncbi:MAG: hypothetical protein ACXW06_07140 [Halobacteriota archaeon]
MSNDFSAEQLFYKRGDIPKQTEAVEILRDRDAIFRPIKSMFNPVKTKNLPSLAAERLVQRKRGENVRLDCVSAYPSTIELSILVNDIVESRLYASKQNKNDPRGA